MRIRRYTGKDAQEALLKVKMDLGSEAVILSTRKVRKKGFAGLFAKPLTEVLAAIDEDYENKKDTPDTAKKGKPAAGFYNRQGAIKELQEEDIRVESLENRVKQMESMLERILNSVQKGKEDKKKEEDRNAGGAGSGSEKKAYVSPPQAAEKLPRETEKNKEAEDGDAYKTIKKHLAESEIEPVIAERLVEKIKQFVKEPARAADIFDTAEKILINLLGQPQTIRFREDGKPTVILFAGPTGVGKTTTLAKIAANYSLNQNKKVGLITADTYRIAAVEQLKTYAEILNIPVSVIYTPQEVKEAIAALPDRDLVLIDTAGRSHKNSVQFSELKMLVAAAEADEVYLVLSCGSSRTACREIVRHYSFLKNYKLLFTKLDEAFVPGVILNARFETGRPLSYTTAGQNVPDDIETANVNEIAKSILHPEGGGI